MSAPYFGEKFNQRNNDQKIYWHVNQIPCWKLGHYHLNGYEHQIAFSTFNVEEEDENLTATPRLLCSNRELPKLIPFGGDEPKFSFQGKNFAFIKKITCISNITSTKYRDMEQSTQTDLLAHITHNQQSFANNEQCLEMLRDILMLYDYDSKNNIALFEKGLIKASTKEITKRHPNHLKFGFCQGTQFHLTIDETHFAESSVYLFGCVLELFLSKLSSINSFIQLKLSSEQRGEIHTWPVRLGIKQVI